MHRLVVGKQRTDFCEYVRRDSLRFRHVEFSMRDREAEHRPVTGLAVKAPCPHYISGGFALFLAFDREAISSTRPTSVLNLAAGAFLAKRNSARDKEIFIFA
jgi:hypothetical protein